ncbi:MAG: hypothetical protein KDD66_14760 [Bdellovibrionales bacterium]|nr:hypothetical protein [Bdellovibrionales bacterium]
MGSLTELFDNILSAMGHYDVSNRDPLIFFALFFGITALGLSLSKLFVKRREPNQGKITKLNDKVDELSLRVDDFAGRLSTAGTNFERIINDVRQRMRYLEERLENMENRPIESPDFELYGGENLEDRLNFLQEAVEKMLGSFTAEDGLQLALEGQEPEDLDFDENEEEEGAEALPPLSYAAGLSKSRDVIAKKLRQVLKAKDPGDEDGLIEPIKEVLLDAEFGPSAVDSLMASLCDGDLKLNDMTLDDVRSGLAKSAAKLVAQDVDKIEIAPKQVNELPKVVLIVGSDYEQKVQAIKRLATHFAEQGAKVMVGACDSYSSESRSELTKWSKESGILVLSGPDKVKSTTIAYKALHRAQDDQADILLVDTPSGHEKKSTIHDEIKNVINMISREQPDAPHETLLIFKASSYEQTLEPIRELNANLDLSGICVTRIEKCATAANLVAVSRELDVPIRYVSIGDEQRGFKAFSPIEFSAALFTGRIEDSDESEAAAA